MSDLSAATAALVDATGQIIGTKAELLAWAVGTVAGGPNGNGDYPFTAADGTIILLPCIAKLKVLNGDPTAAIAQLQALVDGTTAALNAKVDLAHRWAQLAVGEVDPAGYPGERSAYSYAAEAAGYRDAAQGYRDATQALLATVQDFSNDAASLQEVQRKATTLGRVTVDQALTVANAGVLFSFTRGIYRHGVVNKAAPERFTQFALTRASSAYGLTTAGLYQPFAVNILRVTDAGAIIEATATNDSDAPTSFTAWGTIGGTTLTRTTGIGSAIDTEGLYKFTRWTFASGNPYQIQRTRTFAAGPRGFIYILSPAIGSKRRYQYGAVLASGLQPGTVSFVIDWDADGPGLPAITYVNGSFLCRPRVARLANGNIRLDFALDMPNTPATVSFGSATSAASSAPVAIAAGESHMGLALEQIEVVTAATGYAPSSPIFTAGGTRAADVPVLALPPGAPGDQLIMETALGTTTFPRSVLPDQSVFNWVTNGPSDGSRPWISTNIKSFTLAPALDKALLATGERGITPWLVARNGTFMANGVSYASEAEMIAAVGGTGTIAGGTFTIANYVAPDALNLLAGVDFTSNVQGFTNIGGPVTAAVSGGYLKMTKTATGTIGAVSRTMRVSSGRAYRFSGTMKTDALSGGPAYLAATLFNSGFGVASTSLGVGSLAGATRQSVILSGGEGQLFVGMVQYQPVTGASYVKDLELVETSPAKGFPSGNFTIAVAGVAPNSLPSATQVIAQTDDGDDADRQRIEIRSDGGIWLALATVNQSVSFQIGTLTAAQPFQIEAAFGRSGTRGSVNGTGIENNVQRYTVGAAAFRLGRSATGSSIFTGQITALGISGGSSTLDAMNRRTATATPTLAVKSNALWYEGDSYSEAGTGFSSMVADMMNGTAPLFDVVVTGLGGSTFESQYLRLTDSINLAALKQRTVVWEDGDPNGRVLTSLVNASISGTTLTLAQAPSSPIYPGCRLSGTGVIPNTKIVSGSGLAWVVDTNHATATGAQTITAQAAGLQLVAASGTGYMSGGTLTIVTLSGSGGPLTKGSQITLAGANAPATITGYGTGIGGTGTYTVDSTATMGSAGAALAFTAPAFYIPNGLVELWMILQVVAAIGHKRLLYVRSAQVSPQRSPTATALITKRENETLDLDATYAGVVTTLGAASALDRLPALLKLPLAAPVGSALLAAGQSDSQYGYIPRTLTSDGVHVDINNRIQPPVVRSYREAIEQAAAQ